MYIVSVFLNYNIDIYSSNQIMMLNSVENWYQLGSEEPSKYLIAIVVDISGFCALDYIREFFKYLILHRRGKKINFSTVLPLTFQQLSLFYMIILLNSQYSCAINSVVHLYYNIIISPINTYSTVLWLVTNIMILW